MSEQRLAYWNNQRLLVERLLQDQSASNQRDPEIIDKLEFQLAQIDEEIELLEARLGDEREGGK